MPERKRAGSGLIYARVGAARVRARGRTVCFLRQTNLPGWVRALQLNGLEISQAIVVGRVLESKGLAEDMPVPVSARCTKHSGILGMFILGFVAARLAAHLKHCMLPGLPGALACLLPHRGFCVAHLLGRPEAGLVRLPGFISRLYTLLVRASLARADMRVFVSKQLRDEFGRPGDPVVPDTKFSRNSITFNQARPAHHPARVLFVGRLSPEKNLDLLLESMGKDKQLWVAGTGPEQARLKAKARAMGLSVKWLGWLEQKQLWQIASRCDVLVLPSVSEGLPNAVVEAMAMGVPVVATKVGGIPELLGDGAGLLVEPGDGQGLSRAIEKALWDDRLRASMVSKARKRALELCLDNSVKPMAQRLQGAFRQNPRETGPRVLQVAAEASTVAKLLLPLMKRMKQEGWEVEFACRPGPLARKVESEGFRFHPWDITRRINPIENLRALFQMISLLRREKFDLIHTHTPLASFIARIGAWLAKGPRVVYTVHGFYHHENMSPVSKWLFQTGEKLAARATDLMFFQSREDHIWALEQSLLPGERLTHIGNGVDLSDFDLNALDIDRLSRLRQQLGSGPVVLSCGRLVKEKGFGDLVQASALVLKKVPNALFVLAGQGPELRELRAKAHQLGVIDNWRFLGWRDDLPELLALAEVFVLPSWREGMPRSIIEAMASGVPVVATDIRGCREEVVHAQTGFLVPLRDISGLASAITVLLRDPALAVAMGQRAKQRARSGFDENKVLQKQIDTLNNLFFHGSKPPYVPEKRARVRVDALSKIA